MEMPEIKAGQIWKQRNKKLVLIEKILDNNGKTPVKAGDDYWMKNGRFWSNKFDHSKDLIMLIS